MSSDDDRPSSVSIEELPPLTPGLRLGKYVLRSRLAQGGMAEVWTATATGPEGFNMPVAIKFMLDELTADPRFHRMFHNEAKIASELRSSNVVSILDFDRGADDADAAVRGRYYIVMELVEGRDLSRLVKILAKAGHALPPKVVLYIMGEVLKGLTHIHGRRKDTVKMRLVHRDISPQNVMVTYSGEVKVSDFGIARSMQRQLTGGFSGKLRYTAPELLSDGVPSHLSDQFAAGVVMWELLEGRALFDGSDDVQIINLVRKCEIPPLGPRVRPEIAAIVTRMLARRPEDRFPETRAAWTAMFEAPGYSPDGSLLGEIMQFFFPDTQRWSMQVGLPRALLEDADMPVTAPPPELGYPVPMDPSIAVAVDRSLLEMMPAWPEFVGRGAFADVTIERWRGWWRRRGIERGGR